MAEHFRGRLLTVHASNGATAEMFNAWLVLGARMAPNDDLAAVLSFLQDRTNRGEGWKAFGFAPPPERINSPARLECFAKIVGAFAEQLMDEQPDPALTTLAWDRQLRMSWLAKMLDLLEILEDLVPLSTKELLPSLPTMPAVDRVLCDLNRTANRQAEAKRRGTDAKVMIEWADKMIALLLQLSADNWRDGALSAARQDRAGLLIDEGQTAVAAGEMRLALELERDPDRRAEMSIIIEDLCGE